jgi:hypothetical protein
MGLFDGPKRPPRRSHAERDEANRKFNDLRGSGYRGGIDQDGDKAGYNPRTRRIEKRR